MHQTHLQELHTSVRTLCGKLGHSLLEGQVLLQHAQHGQERLHHRKAAAPHQQPILIFS